MSWQQQPQDQAPYGYEPPARQRSDMPAYNVAPPPQPYPRPPVVVNVVQNAYGRPVYVQRRINHKLHLWLTLLTGGGWGLFVWIPLALRGSKKVTVYR